MEIMKAPKVHFRESCIKISFDDLEEILDENIYLKGRFKDVMEYYHYCVMRCFSILDSDDDDKEKFEQLKNWLRQFGPSGGLTIEVIKVG